MLWPQQKRVPLIMDRLSQADFGTSYLHFSNKKVEKVGLAEDLLTFRCRFATWADLEQLIDLERAGYQGYQAWRLVDFKEDWKHNPYAVYTLVDCQLRDGSWELVAMISGRFRYRGGHISHLIVAPPYQALGLGTYLLELWFAYAQQLSVKQITLEVRENNAVAIALYKKMGFQEVGWVHAYYDTGEAALKMRKILGERRDQG